VLFRSVLAAVGMPRNRDQRGGEIGNTNLEKQRVVGYGDVRQDGSFSIELPARLSVHLQTLDENGMMLVSQRSWTQVQPGEKRLCTGCHDSHDRDKIIFDLEIESNDKVLNKETSRIYDSGFDNAMMVTTHAAAKGDTVDFFDRTQLSKSNTVQAAFDANCISCHNNANAAGGLSLATLAADRIAEGDNGNGTTSVYETLTDGDRYMTAEGDNRDYVTDDGARRSPLLWVMYNRQLDDDSNEDYQTGGSYDHSQLWTKTNGFINPFNPANKGLLTIIEWVDMGTDRKSVV